MRTSVVEHISRETDTLATTLFDAPRMLHIWDGTAPPLGYLLHVETPAEGRLALRRSRKREFSLGYFPTTRAVRYSVDLCPSRWTQPSLEDLSPPKNTKKYTVMSVIQPINSDPGRFPRKSTFFNYITPHFLLTVVRP